MKYIKCKIANKNEYKNILVDDEDFDYLNQFKWHENTFGYAVTDFYKNKIKKKIRMHRLIMNPPSNLVIDHINGNICDNRKSNLRVCTQLLNTVNRKLGKHSTSNYKGVSLEKRRNHWRSYISFNGKQIYLGSYKTAKEAAIAYNKSSLDYYGEFARLNEI